MNTSSNIEPVFDTSIQKILLIEDSSTAVALVRMVFENEPIEIIATDNLAAGLKLAENPESGSFDLVLLDLNLPDSSGLDTLHRFRETCPSYPIVVLTGTSDEAIGIEAINIGADDYLIKDETYPILLRRQAKYAVQRKLQRLALEQAKDSAEKANNIKDQFVALVAHDLRGPLGAISGLIETMLMLNDPPLDEKHKDTLSYIENSCKNLLTVVGEILDISRLQTGQILPDCRFIDGHYVVEDVISRLHIMAKEKGITITNDVAVNSRLFADEILFGQVLQNLGSNAIKFAKTDTVIRIFPPDEFPGTIAVVDQGVGIPEHVIPKLFILEEKVSTQGTGGEQGTGFGLPLSNNIMKAHNGEITVESVVGTGSTFFARLPPIIPRVLVIDDEAIPRTVIKAQLASIGAESVEAKNGRDALKILDSEGPFHLVICDIIMPEMDGFEFLESLQANPRTLDLPVIMVTGDDSAETRERTLRLGAIDFAVKPIVSHEFIPRVRRVIG